MMDGNASALHLLQHVLVDQAHHLLFLRATHGVYQGHAVVVDEKFHPKAAPFGRQRQAEGAATTVAGGHENGRSLPPDAQLQLAIQDQVRAQGVHGHHQGRGSAGEFEGLLVEGHPMQRRLQVRGQGLLVAQGLHVVLVIIREDSEASVTRRLEQGLGGQVVAPDLQAHVGTVLPPDRHLGRGDEEPTYPLGACLAGDRDGIEPRHRGPPTEEHHHVPRQPSLWPSLWPTLRPFGHQCQGLGAGQHVAELAAGQAIGREAGVLQPHQGTKIGKRGRTHLEPCAWLDRKRRHGVGGELAPGMGWNGRTGHWLGPE